NGLPIAGPFPYNIPNGLGKANPDMTNTIRRCAANGDNCGLRVSPAAATIANDANVHLINRSDQFVVFGNSVMVQEIAFTQFKEVLGEKGRERKQAQTDSGTGAAQTNAGIAEIRITFAVKNSSKAIGAGKDSVDIRRVQKYLLTPVSVDAAGNIINCQLPDNQAILEADYELCESLGGSYGNNKCTGGTESLTDSTRKRMCDRIGGSYSAA